MNKIKKYWIHGMLALCILSSFTTLALNLSVIGISALVLLSRLLFKKFYNTTS